jgi:hypothetical protein
MDASYFAYPAKFPAFSATNTNNAQQNTVDVAIGVCGGYTAKFGSCIANGGSASGYNNIRLYNAADTQVAAGGLGLYSAGGNFCNSDNHGAWFTHAFTGACQTYVVKQGCYYSYSCSGTVAITVTGACAATSSYSSL